MNKKFEFVEAKIDCNRNYSLKDTFKFELRMLFHEPVETDLEFEIIYFIYKDRRTIEDYSLGKFKISSSKTGEATYELESSPIDISKIPVRTLFGLTSFLLSGRYQNKEFVRVGYVVNVGYQGLSDRELDAINERENPEDSEEDMVDDIEEDAEDDEIIEDEDEAEEEDAEDDEDNNEEDEDNNNEDEEDNNEEDDNASSEYDNSDCDDDSNMDDNGCSDGETYKEAGADANEDDKNEEKEEAQIEDTYIDPNVDDFEFAGKEMKQSLIELKLLENPIIQLFDIDVIDNTNADIEEEELVESSDTDFSEDGLHKKPKLNE